MRGSGSRAGSIPPDAPLASSPRHGVSEARQSRRLRVLTYVEVI
jgi:hypothetical protein